jgi:hypothetical protein
MRPRDPKTSVADREQAKHPDKSGKFPGSPDPGIRYVLLGTNGLRFPIHDIDFNPAGSTERDFSRQTALVRATRR